MVIHLRNGLDCFTFEQKKLVMGRCEIRFFHQFWMVFQPWQKIILDVYKPQPWQKIMNGMLKKYQHRKFIFNWWKEKRISQRPIHIIHRKWCSKVNHPHGSMVLCLGIRGNPIMATAWQHCAVQWEKRCCDLCDLCVILWRILTLYKTKADKDFSAH